MPPKNYTLLPLEKNKKKLNVKLGELNMLEILNTDLMKSPSSDKLKKS